MTMRCIFPYRMIGLLRLERLFEIIKSTLRTDQVGHSGVLLVAWLFSSQFLKWPFHPRWCSLSPGSPLGPQECERDGEEPGCSQVTSGGSCYSSFLLTTAEASLGPHLAEHLQKSSSSVWTRKGLGCVGCSVGQGGLTPPAECHS